MYLSESVAVSTRQVSLQSERKEFKCDDLRHVDLLMEILNHLDSSRLTNSKAQSLKCLKVRSPLPPTSTGKVDLR